MQQERNVSLASQNKKKKRNRVGGGLVKGGGWCYELNSAGHLSSSNVAIHLVAVRTGWHWSTAFEAEGKSSGQYTAATA